MAYYKLLPTPKIRKIVQNLPPKYLAYITLLPIVLVFCISVVIFSLIVHSSVIHELKNPGYVILDLTATILVRMKNWPTYAIIGASGLGIVVSVAGVFAWNRDRKESAIDNKKITNVARVRSVAPTAFAFVCALLAITYAFVQEKEGCELAKGEKVAVCTQETAACVIFPFFPLAINKGWWVPACNEAKAGRVMMIALVVLLFWMGVMQAFQVFQGWKPRNSEQEESGVDEQSEAEELHLIGDSDEDDEDEGFAEERGLELPD
ncbi:hypothetical protein K469DRAFT_682252 [Zopfia rhizophila CBS 207.26]|uniref:Uncharacterized protein n=1 Tax=Zopfia rhizophila CBS 207.26 TaxID=1314779 RepID=A0A6A6EDL1_9PEZI|nr:hypothetical protein K469DRAFT_682252 [Zopfia rhizophila CBS 207.26]